MPAGWFEARDGRDGGRWYLDAALANQVIALATARQTPFVIDYEHQTLHADTSGQPAPAAGWFTRLEWREGDGLYATDVQWTAKASAYISNDEYRYLSPVFAFNPENGAVQELFMAAVTNNPAIDGIADLAAARFNLNSDQPPNEETTPVDEKTLKLLGLSKDATEAEISAAVAALKAKTDGAAVLNAKTLEALGLKEDTDPEAVNTAVTALAAARTEHAAPGEPDPTKFVPIAAVQDLQGQIAALRADHTGKEVDSLVAEGLADGRLTKGLESWARDLGKKDVAALRSFLGSAQPIAALSGTQTNGREMPDTNTKLTPSEMAVCKATGVSHAQFLKAKEAQQAS